MKTVSATNSASANFPAAKIQEAVAGIIPAGKTFEIRIADSGIENLKIVRIVTDAWNRLPRYQRIEAVTKAVSSALSPEEENAILRFNVLTRQEYRTLMENARRPQ